MNCPVPEPGSCENGRTKLQDGSVVQKYCVNLAANNSMTGLAPHGKASYPSVIVSAALNVRTEGLHSCQAVVCKSHSTVIAGNNDSLQLPVVPLHQKVLMSPGREKYTLVSVRTFQSI